MLTLPDLVKRYPAMLSLTTDQFTILQADAVRWMGYDDGRWGIGDLGVYEPAQAALIAHFYTTVGSLFDGDAAIPNAPVTRTDVDDVQVEFGSKIWDKVPYQEADIMSTAYGQMYVRYRSMFFSGPRFA